MLHYDFSGYDGCYRDLTRLGLPIIIGQLGTIVMSFADTLMIGHHSTPELAAASFVNNMFVLVIIVALGYSYSITPTVGNLFGRGLHTRIGKVLLDGVASNLLVAAILVAAMLLLYANIGRLGQPEELLPLMRPYFLVQLVSLPFVCVANAFKQFYDGITDTRTPMWILLSGNLLNILGNWLLIYGHLGLPEMGLLGAGLSTAFSRLFVAVAFVGLFCMSRSTSVYRAGLRSSRVSWSGIVALSALGIPLAMQMGMETAAFSLSSIMVGWLGADALAAHQIMLTVSQLGFMVYYGFGAAVAIKVSLQSGLRDYVAAGRTAHAGFHLSLMVAALVSVPIFVFRHSLGFLFTDAASVAHLVALTVVPFMLYQIGDCLQCAYANALRGIAVVRPLVSVAFLAYFVISLPLGYLLGIVLGMGIEGVWLAFPAGLTTAGLLYFLLFVRNLRRSDKDLRVID